MTATARLKELYERKAADGLLDVKFSLDFGNAIDVKQATAEEIAEELLRLDAAIAAGNFKPLDFGDSRLRLPLPSDNCGCPACVTRRAAT